jgi:hypothetical protein
MEGEPVVNSRFSRSQWLRNWGANDLKVIGSQQFLPTVVLTD